MMRTELTVDQMNQVNGGEEAELINRASDLDIDQVLDKVTPTCVKNTYNTVKTTAGTIFFYGKTFLDRIF
jgi:hypothetical protein